jgi:antitoxin MazE
MKTKLIQIGNSKGICIPNSLIKNCGFGDEVTLEVQNKQLVIHSGKKPRENWERDFKSKVKNIKDKTLDEFINFF